MLERSKSEVLRDNANVVAAEEKCSSIIVFLRVPSLACLCAATHSCVRSFVPSSMYTVLLSWGRTVRTICGCHCVWCRPLSTCRPTTQQSSKGSLLDLRRCRRHQGLQHPSRSCSPRTKPAEALYDVHVRAPGGYSEYRGSRLPVLGVSTSAGERMTGFGILTQHPLSYGSWRCTPSESQ